MRPTGVGAKGWGYYCRLTDLEEVGWVPKVLRGGGGRRVGVMIGKSSIKGGGGDQTRGGTRRSLRVGVRLVLTFPMRVVCRKGYAMISGWKEEVEGGGEVRRKRKGCNEK
eukprot:760135-Hanusia_phi.AAC.2